MDHFFDTADNKRNRIVSGFLMLQRCNNISKPRFFGLWIHTCSFIEGGLLLCVGVGKLIQLCINTLICIFFGCGWVVFGWGVGSLLIRRLNFQMIISVVVYFYKYSKAILRI